MGECHFFLRGRIESAAKPGHFVVEESIYAIDGEVTPPSVKRVASVHICRIAVLLLEWKLNGAIEFLGSDNEVWRHLHDGLSPDKTPDWLEAIFGDRERFHKLIRRDVGRRLCVTRTFRKKNVRVRVRAPEGNLLRESASLEYLWNSLSLTTNNLIPSAIDFVSKIAAVKLHLPHLDRKYQVLAGKVLWLSKAMELAQLLGRVVSPPGTLGWFIEELAISEQVGIARGLMIEWNTRAGLMVDELEEVYGEFATELHCPISDIVRAVREVLERTEEWVKNGTPSYAEILLPSDMGRALVSAKKARKLIDGSRVNLARSVERCRRQLEWLFERM